MARDTSRARLHPCLLGQVRERLPGHAIAVSTTDNLVEGASGRTAQEIKVMLGLGEAMGLGQQPFRP